MATQRLTFGEWLPDQPGIAGSLTEAKNVVSQAVGYGPLPLPVAIASGASENLQTLFATKDTEGNTKLFAGGSTKVFTASSIGVFTDVSGATYTTFPNERMRFTQFGNSVLFTNNSDKIQYYDVTSSSAFADLSANAPIARYITVVRDFVVVANVVDGTNRRSNRVQWSGINDETEWTFSQTTQSDYQDIPDGGNIVGIRGGEFGLVLMEKAIHRMTYIGTPFIFQFDNISRGTGCIEGNSIAQYQGITFFLSDDGFYMCDGQTVKQIGSEKVDRFFFSRVEMSQLGTMSAAVDPLRKLVIWNYRTANGTRELLIYSMKTGKWTRADGLVDYISDAATGAVTLEELDSIYPTVDGMDLTLDSYNFVGGKFFFGGTKDNDIYSFTGLPRQGEIITGDIDTGNSVITLARPQIDGGSADVSVASRTRLDVSLSYTTPVSASDENRVPLRSAGRYHRVKVNPTGDNWANAVAVDIDIVPQGGR